MIEKKAAGDVFFRGLRIVFYQFEVEPNRLSNRGLDLDQDGADTPEEC